MPDESKRGVLRHIVIKMPRVVHQMLSRRRCRKRVKKSVVSVVRIVQRGAGEPGIEGQVVFRKRIITRYEVTKRNRLICAPLGSECNE